MKNLWRRFLARFWWDRWPQRFALEFRCGFRGHGPDVYFNPGGFEPDTSCSDCGLDDESTRAFLLGIVVRHPFYALSDPWVRSGLRSEKWVVLP